MPIYKTEIIIQGNRVWVEARDEATAGGVGIVLRDAIKARFPLVDTTQPDRNTLDAQRKHPDCICGTLRACPIHDGAPH